MMIGSGDGGDGSSSGGGYRVIIGWVSGETGRERERERQRETETDRPRQKETETERRRQAETETNRDTDTEREERETERDRDRHRQRQRHRETETNRDTERQRQTETDRDRQRQTETDRDRDTARRQTEQEETRKKKTPNPITVSFCEALSYMNRCVLAKWLVQLLASPPRPWLSSVTTHVNTRRSIMLMTIATSDWFLSNRWRSACRSLQPTRSVKSLSPLWRVLRNGENVCRVIHARRKESGSLSIHSGTNSTCLT